MNCQCCPSSAETGRYCCLQFIFSLWQLPLPATQAHTSANTHKEKPLVPQRDGGLTNARESTGAPVPMALLADSPLAWVSITAAYLLKTSKQKIVGSWHSLAWGPFQMASGALFALIRMTQQKPCLRVSRRQRKDVECRSTGWGEDRGKAEHLPWEDWGSR